MGPNDQPSSDDFRPIAPRPPDLQHPMQPPGGPTVFSPADNITLPQFPTTNNVPPPQPGKPGKSKMSDHTKRLIAFCAGMAILIIVSVVGAILTTPSTQKQGTDEGQTSGSSSSSSGSTSPRQGDCQARFRRYSNKALDFRFCYPDAWGDASVKDAKFDPSDNGSRKTITFFAKPEVHIGLVSDDWTTNASKSPTCTDPANQMLPDYDAFSAPWLTTVDDPPAFTAVRGIDISPQLYMIQEMVDTVTTKGVCLEGFYFIDGHFFSQAKATYFKAFSTAIPDPKAHINDPTKLISGGDRRDFANMVKSMHKY